MKKTTAEILQTQLVLRNKDICQIMGCSPSYATKLIKKCIKEFDGKAGYVDGVKTYSFMNMIGYENLPIKGDSHNESKNLLN